MLSTIHPFPARMAPEVVQACLDACPNGGQVLDPMCGSGTVLRAAVEAGLECTGVDIDPLSVLLSRVWTTPLVSSKLMDAANNVILKAKDLHRKQIEQISDPETEQFIAFWFAPRQKYQLRRLATVLRGYSHPEAHALMVALSRIIVTKVMMASLARDTSHSRPHRVATQNNFDVFDGFLKAASHVAKRLSPELIKGKAEVFEGDARMLGALSDDTFDLAVTSPPYLNAIDYLRGHRLTLVWLGYDLSSLRAKRATSIGAEKILASNEYQADVRRYVIESANSTFAERHLGWVRRYASDMQAVLDELARVIKRHGTVVMVIGNSFLSGAVVNNAMLVRDIARVSGFLVENASVRSIPARRRYLPPPSNGNSQLDTRMREETVLRLRLKMDEHVDGAFPHDGTANKNQECAAAATDPV